MDLRQIYNDILTDHNQHPSNAGIMEHPDLILEGVNPSCGDDYTLQLQIHDNKITDGKFAGDGCAISKASVDIMLDLMIGKTTQEALHLSKIFQNMVKGTATDQEIEELEDAGILESVSHMPARVKCAVLGWRTVEDMLKKES